MHVSYTTGPGFHLPSSSKSSTLFVWEVSSFSESEPVALTPVVQLRPRALLCPSGSVALDEFFDGIIEAVAFTGHSSQLSNNSH